MSYGGFCQNSGLALLWRQVDHRRRRVKPYGEKCSVGTRYNDRWHWRYHVRDHLKSNSPQRSQVSGNHSFSMLNKKIVCVARHAHVESSRITGYVVCG